MGEFPRQALTPMLKLKGQFLTDETLRQCGCYLKRMLRPRQCLRQFNCVPFIIFRQFNAGLNGRMKDEG